MTQTQSHAAQSGNPFFEDWATPDRVPPFDRIAPEHFRKAIVDFVDRMVPPGT